MKKKRLIYTILPVLVFALLGTGVASACGWGGFLGFGNADPDKVTERQQVIFQNQSQVLGIGVDEIKEAWAEGKTIQEIMEEKGISQEEVQARMKEIRLKEMESYLQILVEKGVITQNQAGKRLQIMQDFEQNKTGKMGRGFRMGMGFGRGFGW